MFSYNTLDQGGSRFHGHYNVGAGGSVQQGNVVHIHQTANPCLSDLRVTDPSDDKQRIQENSGGLLEGCYDWVLSNPHYSQWRSDGNRPLWIKGARGKGKTMLVCGIIDKLENQTAKGKQLSYFFCQDTDQRIRTATAVLRGLIYMLVYRDNSLLAYVEKKYNAAGKALFEDVNAWQALSGIFTNMLHDRKLQGVCLIVDALDECIDGLEKLLDLIEQTSKSTSAKWLVSSKNSTQIRNRLDKIMTTLSLEDNTKSLSAAVDEYIKTKVCQLKKSKNLQDDATNAVRQYLCSRADGTFLWVALVCQDLARISRCELLNMLRTPPGLESFPPGLDALYSRMMEQIQYSRNTELYTKILAIAVATYRPLSLEEATTVIEEFRLMEDDRDSVNDTIDKRGSFLTLHENTIYFVHSSAKEFLVKHQSSVLFPQGETAIHSQIFSQSIDAMSNSLESNIYKLSDPGIHIRDVIRPTPDPLAKISYSCIYWARHLLDSSVDLETDSNFQDGGSTHKFLKDYCLYWIESLTLLRGISDGMVALARIGGYLQQRTSCLKVLAGEAYRFLLSFRLGIENWPIQTYASALMFSPTETLLRKAFSEQLPEWVECKSGMSKQWSADITFEGHIGLVRSAAFSADGQRVVSASSDTTVKVWNVETGECVNTLRGHTNWVNSAAFSADGQRVISASFDTTVKIWDAKTGGCVNTLRGHTNLVRSAAFSADGQRVVSASSDTTVKIWDVETGRCVNTLRGHTGWVNSAAFSADGQRVVSASDDKTVKIWDVAKSKYVTFVGHTDWVRSAAFSADGQHVVSASFDKTIKIWDVETGGCVNTLNGHTDCIRSAAFSADGQHVVSASFDKTIKIWDVEMGGCVNTLNGHTDWVNSAAFSADGQRVVSASDDKTVKIWDVAKSKYVTFVGHTDCVNLVAFSTDEQRVVSASDDKTVKIWKVDTGECVTFQGHTYWVNSAAFSADGQRVVSASSDKTIKIWDVKTGGCVNTLNGHTDWVNSAAFSADGQRVVSASDDTTVKIWDVKTGGCVNTLSGHTDWVNSAAFSADGQRVVSASVNTTVRVWSVGTREFSHIKSANSAILSADGQRVVSASSDTTVKIWDVETGGCVDTLHGHTNCVNSAAFSADGRRVVSASSDKTIKIWDVKTGGCVNTLRGHKNLVRSATFSADGQRVISASFDTTVKIWDAKTGGCVNTLRGHTNLVRSAAFSADGQRVVSASSDTTVKIWDVETGECVDTLRGHTDWVNSAAFSPDGQRVVSASSDTTVKIWDVETGRCVDTLHGHTDWVNSAAFSPDGQNVVSASFDKTVIVWDTETGERTIYDGHTRFVSSAAFSADGQRVVSASFDTTVRVWDVRRVISSGHTGWVNSAAFSADGKHVVSASSDKTVIVWDTETGERTIYHGHTDCVNSAAFSADGQRVVSASEDKTVKIWDVAKRTCLSTYNTGYTLTVSFHSTGTDIHTDTGNIRWHESPSAHPGRDTMTAPQYIGYSLGSDRTWVSKESQSVLWLPWEYRPTCSAVSAAKEDINIVLGCSLGRVVILHFSESNSGDGVLATTAWI